MDIVNERPNRMERVRRWVDNLSTEVGDVNLRPLIRALAAGLGLVILCRLMLTFSVSARAWIAAAGVAVVLVVALTCLAVLLWAAWRIRLDAAASGRLLVALAVSVVALGVCTEAFAGTTALLWRHGRLAVGPGVEPALWRTELYY